MFTKRGVKNGRPCTLYKEKNENWMSVYVFDLLVK